NDTVTSKRIVYETIKDRDIIKKLFGDIALRYKNRNGGYTRIFKLGKRTSDGTEMAIIELVEESLAREAAPAVPVAPAVPSADSGEGVKPEKGAKTAKKRGTGSKTSS